MDEWEKLSKEMRILGGSKVDPELLSGIDEISVSDYWKRRYEQEKQAWEEKLRAKEHEKAKLKESFQQEEQGLRELTFRLRELEQRLEWEKQIADERVRVKAMQAELEMKKTELEAKAKIFEQENEQLRIRLRMGADQLDEESRRRQKIESEKARLEEEIRFLNQQLRGASAAEGSRIQQLESERGALQRQIEELRVAKAAAPSEELKKVAESSAEAVEKLRRLFDAREKIRLDSFEDLARGFAHKVRNYLGVISGTLQLCLANYKMEEELKNQVVMVDENAQEMLKAIEEYLALTKVPELDFQATPFAELIASVLPQCEDLAKAQGVTIERKLEADLPSVPLDSRLLREAFKELIDNAIEASGSGKTLTIAARRDPAQDALVVQIVDSGQGIADSHLKKIFQPYFTTKKGKKGLGLTLAKRAVDLHHGSIAVSSVRDRGTSVTVQLPLGRK